MREWPTGTEQQLVLGSEREKGGKEKAARGERQGEDRKGHIHTLTMGMEDKRMMVFVYNLSTRAEMSKSGWMLNPAAAE